MQYYTIIIIFLKRSTNRRKKPIISEADYIERERVFLRI